MDTYDFLVAAHVICAVAWIGASTYTSVLIRRIVSRGEEYGYKTFFEDMSWAAPRYFIPISLGTIAFGFAVIADGPYSFDNSWVGIGMGMFIVSFLVGAGFLGPQMDKSKADLEQYGVDGAQFQARFNKVKLVHSLDLIWLYAIIFVMVAKPG